MRNPFLKVHSQLYLENLNLSTSFCLFQGPDFFICLIYNLFGLDKTSTQGQGYGYLAYLDNILIYSRSEQEHLQMLDKAFKCLLKSQVENQVRQMFIL